MYQYNTAPSQAAHNTNLRFFNVHKSSGLACIGAISSTLNFHPYYLLVKAVLFSQSHLWFLFYLFKFTAFAPPSFVHAHRQAKYVPRDSYVYWFSQQQWLIYWIITREIFQLYSIIYVKISCWLTRHFNRFCINSHMHPPAAYIDKL